MKKIFFAIVMMLSIMTETKAENNAVSNIEAYTTPICISDYSLQRSFDMSVEQAQSVNECISILSQRMSFIGAEAMNGYNREVISKMTRNAITENLRLVRSILTVEQYKKYCSVLNSTLLNREIIF